MDRSSLTVVVLPAVAALLRQPMYIMNKIAEKDLIV